MQVYNFQDNTGKEDGMMQNKYGLWVGFAALAAVTALALAGCTTGYTPKNAPETFACVPDNQLMKQIAPEAQLTEFSCAFKKWEGGDTLHFKVGVKNVSDTPQRYRINIFLDNGKAVGGLIPRKTAKGLVAPGATQTFEYPVSHMPRQPKSVELYVRTVAN
jgi:hypothetical protein